VAETEDDPRGLPLPEPSTLLGRVGNGLATHSSACTDRLDQQSPGSSIVAPNSLEQCTAATTPDPSGEDELPSQFHPGDFIAGRYEVVLFVGRGAMGEVYEVNDTHLGEHVALKVLSPSVSSNERAALRFKREIQLARKITHPNVCRIYDLGFHLEPSQAKPSEDFSPVAFFTMELLQGCTLSHRIYSTGRMQAAEALPLVEQLARGLDAAHHAGIVHRDFKCGNVMLVGDGKRAVITDFGLARTSVTTGGDAGSISAIDEVVGTPDYMSPEQVRGDDATPASDIYAFGLVIYAMVTGQLPFQGSSARQRALKRLEEKPVLPRHYVPELDRHWEKAILRCLAREPKGRPERATDVVRIIRGETVERSRLSSLLHSRLFVAISAVIVLLALFAVIPTVRQKLRTQPAAQRVDEAKQLAVRPFTAVNADEQTTAFAKGLSETLTTSLTRLTERHALQVIPASEVRSNRVENLPEARREFGVNLGLEGSVERSGPMVRVTYRLINAQTARQLRGETITAPASDPFSLEDEVAASVARALELELNPQEQSTLTPARTAEPAAYDFFLRGRGYLQDYQKPENLDSAVSVLKHALELDAKYAPAYAGLGEAYWYKYEATRDTSWVNKATQACETAIQLDERSTEAHQCLGTVYQGTGKYEMAALQFQRAFELDPTSDDAVRGLASSYASVAKTTEAEETYRRAISLRPQYWRGYNMLGAFYYAHARYDDAAKMFRQVIALAPDNYRGYSNLGATYLIQSDYASAVPLFERAVAIQPTADAYSNLATSYFYLRRFADSAGTFDEAVKLNNHNYIMWGNLANAEHRTPNRHDEALAAYRKAILFAEQQLQVNSRDAGLLGDLADYYSMLGDKSRAEEYITRALSYAPDNASVSFKAAQVYVQLGDSNRAVELLRKALAAGYSRTIVRDSPVMDPLRPDPRMQEMLRSP
jgi:serine/threonine protein kinase/tetratricopeptide (TPR) repeat protein